MFSSAARVLSTSAAPALVAGGASLAFYASPLISDVHASKAEVDLKAVRQDIADLIEKDMEKRGDGTSLIVSFNCLMHCLFSNWCQHGWTHHSVSCLTTYRCATGYPHETCLALQWHVQQGGW